MRVDRNDRFGRKVIYWQLVRDVRFTPESRHRETPFGCPLCANSGRQCAKSWFTRWFRMWVLPAPRTLEYRFGLAADRRNVRYWIVTGLAFTGRATSAFASAGLVRQRRGHRTSCNHCCCARSSGRCAMALRGVAPHRPRHTVIIQRQWSERASSDKKGGWMPHHSASELGGGSYNRP